MRCGQRWPGPQSHTVISLFGLLFSKEEEELSSQMSSFNEAMTQIRELEERAMEELREIIQVRTVPSQGRIGRPLTAQSSALALEHDLGFSCGSLLGWDRAVLYTQLSASSSSSRIMITSTGAQAVLWHDAAD